ncbi:MAG: flagellar motor protein MotB [Dehalococcoidia bacterium]|nr:flagellar motor protein MotB [Dehalococcoidia bacterium]
MSRRRGRGHTEEHPDERWVISYADLVTLLLGFFIILYATADANEVKFEALARGLADAFNVDVKNAEAGGSILDGGTGIVPERNLAGTVDIDLEQIRRLVDERTREAGLQGQILVTRDEDRIVIRLADNLVFPSASADIREEAKPLLAIVAEAVNSTPNEVRVEGHTDNIPLATQKYASNWELSSSRATAVLRYLTEDLGVDPARTFAAGYGEHRPIADNLTPEGRALNRRADIVLLYPPSRIGGGDVAEPTGAGAADGVE